MAWSPQARAASAAVRKAKGRKGLPAPKMNTPKKIGQITPEMIAAKRAREKETAARKAAVLKRTGMTSEQFTKASNAAARKAGIKKARFYKGSRMTKARKKK